MKTSTRLGSIGSLFLIGVFGACLPAAAHPRAFSGSGFFPQQDQHPEEGGKPEVNPPEHPSTHDEKAPDAKTPERSPENTKPTEREDHPPETHAAPEKGNDGRTTTTKENNNRTQTTTKTNVHYTVKSKDVTVIKQHYRTELGHVDRAHRPHLIVGGYIPREQITYIQPVPVEVISGLPPVPAGYVWGYWDGYCVVYDPNTLAIVYVVDLL